MGTPPHAVPVVGRAEPAADDGAHGVTLSPAAGAKVRSDVELTTLAQVGQH